MLGMLKQREWAEQQRLREAERLAAMGKALSAVAHDMKTPLVAIGGFANLVRRHMEATNPYRNKLDIVISETARMEIMVKEMLDFSRPLDVHRSEENVHRLVEESVAVVQEISKARNVTIRNDAPPSLPAVPLDGMRIKQALINLITNAVQASPDGESVNINCGIGKGEMVIDVVDHGPGIPKDRRDEIFAPFVTTKKDGTGLGLSIVKKIIEAHGGRIEVMDSGGKGATFRVFLPVESR